MKTDPTNPGKTGYYAYHHEDGLVCRSTKRAAINAAKRSLAESGVRSVCVYGPKGALVHVVHREEPTT